MSMGAKFFASTKALLFTRTALSSTASNHIDSNTGGGDCTSCQICLVSCPEKLNPSLLIALVSLTSRPTLESDMQAERIDDIVANNLDACTACGMCTEACPSNVALAPLLAKGFRLTTAERAEQQSGDHWKARFLTRQTRMANTVLNRKAKASIRVEKSFNLTSAAGAGKIQSKPRLDPPQSIEPEKNTDTTFSRSSAQDDIAAAVARVKAKRESAKETALTSAANNNNEECK